MKRPDLKQRLAELRQEPDAPPVDITFRLNADLYQTAKALARRHRQPVDVYLVRIIEQHLSGSE